MDLAEKAHVRAVALHPFQPAVHVDSPGDLKVNEVGCAGPVTTRLKLAAVDRQARYGDGDVITFALALARQGGLVAAVFECTGDGTAPSLEPPRLRKHG